MKKLPAHPSAFLVARAEYALINLFARGAGKRIVVAVSGGVDSIALLDLMMTLRTKLGLKIAVAHFNHHLRDTATSDARFVKRVAAKLDLEYFNDSANIAEIANESHTSLEMAGRAARYAFFMNLLNTKPFDTVATAHTRTDNSETVILNFARGGGLNGLAGIPRFRQTGTKAIIRPLLDIDKSEIIEYAAACGLKWREDETNREISIPRNFVRTVLVPEFMRLNPRFAEAVARTSGIVRELLDHLRPEIDRAKHDFAGIPTNRISMTGKPLSIAIQPFKKYFGILRSVALHELLRETFADVLFGGDDIEQVVGLAKRQTGARAQLEGGIVALRDRAHIKVGRATSASAESVALAVNSNACIGGWIIAVREVPRAEVVFGRSNMCAYVDGAAAGTEFMVRPWRDGDAFVPYGMTTRKKISDLLTDAKVSSAERRNVLVLESNGKIAWVCGHRIDNRLKVTPETGRILEFSIVPAAIDHKPHRRA